MLTGIYVRVSTQEQVNEGYSIGEQTERLQAYCTAKGWDVANVYTDGGYSGANTDRPALKQMITDIKQGKLEAVLVYKLDRLSRSQKDTLLLIEDVFNPNNVAFISMNENFDTSTPFGRAMIGILSVFSQLEREQIRERMQMGLDARAKEGLWHGGGWDPIGYDYVDGELIINEYEAEQVRKIHSLFQAGWPINRIRNYMNERYTTKTGGWKHDSSIQSALKTELYTGVINWKGNSYPGKHQAILTQETFDKSQKLYDERDSSKNGGKRYFQAKHMLTGLLYCAHCGGRYFAKGSFSGHKPNRTYRPYYTCYSRAKTNKRMIKDPNCMNTAFAVVKLDEIISDEIKKLIFNPYLLEQATDADDNSSEIKAYEKRISDIDKQLERLLDLYQMGLSQKDEVLERIDKLNIEKERLVDYVEQLEDDEPDLSIEETKAILLTAEEILNSDEKEKKRALTHSLISSIIIDGDEIIINWAFN
ncbi:recombinase family protein [Suicoccus acidiformans]|uniref:Recombinase family protein n=1 Tax=Suicoccus acidiformans TaxID=2036206 RepID=A0A347WIN9_9LACT|nr:recombinase family protein [Suicoccus acidiformans]AXY24946.1 recombinase family protein [Suicoccus acidiformans]